MLLSLLASSTVVSYRLASAQSGSPLTTLCLTGAPLPPFNALLKISANFVNGNRRGSLREPS
jgi:hypothetical protein